MANEKVKKMQEAASEALRACKERTDAAVEAVRKLPDEALDMAAGGFCADFTGTDSCSADYWGGEGCVNTIQHDPCSNYASRPPRK